MSRSEGGKIVLVSGGRVGGTSPDTFRESVDTNVRER